MSRRAATLVTLALLVGTWSRAAGQSPPAEPTPPSSQAVIGLARPAPPDDVVKQFLLKGKVLRTKGASKGVTNTLRATMTDGTITHEAQIQTIDEYKREFKGDQGTEFNFRDSWMYNVAAYEISRLIGFDLVPVSVAGRYRGTPAAFTWWIDDVLMEESARLKDKVKPPDLDRWNRQMQMVRLFDQLIGNVDRNLGNLIITKDWNMWAIDHTRAFRTNTKIKTPGNIARCERDVFERIKQLNKESIRAAVGSNLQTFEIDSLLKRRDEIVEMIEQRGANALFDGLR